MHFNLFQKVVQNNTFFLAKLMFLYKGYRIKKLNIVLVISGPR